MAFRKLLMKELKSIFPLYAVLAAAMVALHLFLLFKSEVWGDNVVFALSMIMPFLFVSSIAVGTAYYQLYTEWRTNSIYLLMSLPVRGWKVLAAKAAAVLILLLLTLTAIGTSFGLILFGTLREAVEFSEEAGIAAVMNMIGNMCWMYVLTVSLLLVLAQFAYLVSQLVARLKWIVALGAFYAGCWLVFRISPFASALLYWMPDFMFGGKSIDVLFMHSGLFIVLALMCAGFVWLNGYLFEKVVEV